jgi:hypothetical protein
MRLPKFSMRIVSPSKRTLPSRINSRTIATVSRVRVSGFLYAMPCSGSTCTLWLDPSPRMNRPPDMSADRGRGHRDRRCGADENAADAGAEKDARGPEKSRTKTLDPETGPRAGRLGGASALGGGRQAERLVTENRDGG